MREPISRCSTAAPSYVLAARSNDRRSSLLSIVVSVSSIEFPNALRHRRLARDEKRVTGTAQAFKFGARQRRREIFTGRVRHQRVVDAVHDQRRLVDLQEISAQIDVAQQSADKDPATMDDQQIRQIMEAAPLMRQLLEAVEKEALRRLEAGTPIPGLKLVHGRGSRAWALPEEEMAEKLVKMGIPKTAIYETKLVTPAKAEKLTWEKRDGTKVSLTDRQLKRMDQEYVAKLAGKLTVVPESDSRPAVITNAAPMFSAIEAAPAAESLPSWLS